MLVRNSRYALRIACPSIRGVTSAVASYLSESGCNISDSAQFDDKDTGRYFMRVSFQSEAGWTLEQLREGFAPIGRKYEAQVDFFDEAVKRKVILMVSQFDHCLTDLLYRWRIGALPID